jgi:hypothetical protein
LIIENRFRAACKPELISFNGKMIVAVTESRSFLASGRFTKRTGQGCTISSPLKITINTSLFMHLFKR